MKDGVIRRSIKLLALARFRFDLGITRIILKCKGEPQYLLCGDCVGCGACCETPMIHTMAPFFYLKTLRWIFLTWQKKVNGFELIKEYRIERTFVFRCTHLDPDTKQCDSYASRPGMCRDYPRNLLYLPRPEFLEECTFSALAENADQIKEVLEDLDDLDLPPETMEKINERGLST